MGHITLVDNDTVGVTNLNRQLCALHSTLGQYKSDVMAARLRDINPEAEICSLPQLYDEAHKEDFFSLQPDYIVDAIDLVSCKLSLIETAKTRNIPIISAMGTGNKQDPSRFQITDISKTTGLSSGPHHAPGAAEPGASRTIRFCSLMRFPSLPAAGSAATGQTKHPRFSVLGPFLRRSDAWRIRGERSAGGSLISAVFMYKSLPPVETCHGREF